MRAVYTEHIYLEYHSKDYEPIRQREEIIRCKDCKYYDERDAGCSYFVLAKNKLLHIKELNGFCSWGERISE